MTGERRVRALVAESWFRSAAAGVQTDDLGEINTVFDEMKRGKIDGRIVIKY